MAIKKSVVIDVKVKGDDSLKKVDKGVKDVGKSAEKTKKEVKEVGDQSQVMGGQMGAAFGAAKGAVAGVIGAFRTLKGAIIASGIGLLLVTVVALKTAFTASEEGQNKFAKIMAVIGSVTGNLVDLLAEFGEFIIDLFSGESEAIKSLESFGKKIFDVIGLPIKVAIDTVKTLAKVFTSLVKGDFTQAFDNLKQGAIDIGMNFVEAADVIVDAYNDATDAAKEFTAELIKEAEIAAFIADQRAKADILERTLLVDRAKATRDISELRGKAAERDKFSAEERIKFLEEAGEIEAKVTDQAIRAAKIRLDTQIAENKLSKSTKEDLDKVAQLEATLIGLTTSKLNLQRRLTTELVTARNEEKAIKAAQAKEQEDELKKIADDETKRQTEIDKIQDEFKAKREDAEAEDEIAKLELEKERSIAKLEALNATEEEKASIIKFWDDEIISNKEKALSNEEKIEDSKRTMQIAAVNNIAGVVSNISALFAKGTQAAKVAAISDIAIKTGIGFVQGLDIAQKTAAATGPASAFTFPLFYATQIASVLGAASRAKGILETVPGGGGGGGGAISAPSIPQPSTISAPSFNVIGDTNTNQITDAINSQNQAPVKAFVVASDVTSQQELDRATISTASL